jgi:hypothetical protein
MTTKPSTRTDPKVEVPVAFVHFLAYLGGNLP